MKKLLFIVFTIFLISIAACQQAVKEDVKKAPEAPKVETTGDAAVDAVGKDLTNVDTIDRDLSTDELADLDSGLQDVQNI